MTGPRTAELESVNNQLRAALRDLHWMARRYADSRMTAAPSALNRWTRQLRALGVALQEPLYARDGMGRAYDGLSEAEAAAAEADMPRALRLTPFQLRVAAWMWSTFDPEVCEDVVERNDRFIEEAIELVQACGGTAERCHALVDYVFGRPPGDRAQEVGGVMVTPAALCSSHRIEMDAAAEAELARIWTKQAEIRAKQAAKPTGSALPGAA